MKQITDQLDRVIEVTSVPQRIVSLVPSQTELLVDLGLKDQIAGITKFCVHPEDLRKQKKIVGGTKQVHYDRIRELQPDIILCNKEENTREMVEELERIAAVHVSDVRDIDSSIELIDQYGQIFDVKEEALEIKTELIQRWRDFEAFIEDKPRRRTAYVIWKDPWMVAGKDNFIDYLLRLNRFENVYGNEEKSRYPEIGLDDLGEKGLDLLLLSTEPFPFGEKHKADLQEKLVEVRIEIVDGEFFSWYGSRLIPAFDFFKQFHRSLLDS